MNYSTSVFLINDDVRGVMCQYEPQVEGARRVTTTLFKTLDKTIKVGDIVNVPSGTRWNYTTVKVTEVDVEPDYDSSVQVEWIVGKIDMQLYERYRALEAAAVDKIRSAEKTDKKRKLREKLLADPALSTLTFPSDDVAAIAPK